MSSDNAPLEFIRDKYSKLILKSTATPKHATEISKETNIPIGTVYRRLEILKNAGFLKIAGYIEDGIRVKTYHNKPRRYNVSNPRISLLLDIIKKNPGISYRGLQKLSGYAFGTLSNSLLNLEKDSRIIVKRSKRRSHYFPLNIQSEEYIVFISLRKETTKRIITFLADNKKGTFSEIRIFVNKAPSTVSLTLTNLIEKNIIRRVSGLQSYFELQNPEIIHNALMRIEPSNVDKMKDRFADTFSYL